MESLQLKATVFIILATFPINGQISCGRRLVHHEGLVTNGFSTKEGDWPWSAAIYHYSAKNLQYKCGGSVVTSNTILTAAHCVFENNRPIISQRVIVHLGKHNLKISGTNVQEFQAHEVIPHPSYNTSVLSNDIAIIRLSTEATFNNYVQPLCLWDENKVSISEVTNKFGTVIGWGVTETDEVSVILKQAVMPVVSFATCLDSNRDFFGSFLSDKNFCAGFRNGTSVCNGDSGGSMTFKDNDVYRIRGIVSLTVSREDKSLCNSYEYVIFTDVAKYLTWIKDLVPQLKTSPTVHNSGQLNFIHSGNVRWTYSCDFAGGDIANEKSRPEECGGLCLITKRCTHFTWTEEENKCLMKQLETDATPTVLRDYEYGTICGWIVPPAKGLHFLIDGTGIWSYNCDFSGGDIGSEKSNPSHCGVLCENREDCTHFTWTSYDGGTCWLKGTGVNPSAYYKHNENTLCGWIVRDRWNIAGRVRWNLKCEFLGDDIKIEKSTAEMCGGLCNNLKDCYYFNWTSLNGGTCWLKGNQVNGQAKKDDEESICGWVKRNI